tara:strand:- start:109 stop:360 length:252 start_codon:yes stop_codon:yes gene_type:complete
MPKITRIAHQEKPEQKDPDVQVICRKHNIGRHDLINIATIVARVGDFTPKEALIKLEETDNMKEFVEQLKIKHAFDDVDEKKS